MRKQQDCSSVDCLSQSNVTNLSQWLSIPCNVCVQALLEQQESCALQGAGRSEEEEGDSLQWQRVAQLLGSKYDRIDPVQALSLLPLQVSWAPVASKPWPHC